MSQHGVDRFIDAIASASGAMESLEGQAMWFDALDITMDEWRLLARSFLSMMFNIDDPTVADLADATTLIQIGYFMAEATR